MIIIDSDVIIYSALSHYVGIRSFMRANPYCVSLVSRVEVLGFRDLSALELVYFEAFFDASTIHAISDEVVNQAVRLRQQRKINLGDSLIAATTIINDFALVTNNIKDFRWIESLTLINPLEVE